LAVLPSIDAIKRGYRFFYPPRMAGDSELYEHLQKLPWYYGSWRWEHDLANEQITERDHVLEVGCGFGSFLRKLLDRNVGCAGLEFKPAGNYRAMTSAERLAQTRRGGLTVSSIRIGIISTNSGAPWGGSEELWAATALDALNAGHEVFVSVLGWTNKAPKLRELECRGAKVLYRHNPNSAALGAGFGVASSFRALFKTTLDVLVISQAWIFDVIAYADLLECLYMTPIPFVLVCQFNENLPLLKDDCHREHARNIFSRAFRVLFVSNQNRIDSERQLAMKIVNSELVLNPVNLSDRSYSPWPDSRIARFASVARLEAKPKGQDILIEALSSDQWKQRDWHLTLYGSGRDERYLRSLVEFFGLQGRITFAGHQSDVRAIWAQEQVLVMFSRAEGIPLALVEAMLCGRPAIVSDVGGNQEWVIEAQTGFVAEAPALRLARAALERAWSARQSWNVMGLEAHKFATAKISDSSIPGLLDVLLEARRHKRPAGVETGEERERLKQYQELTERAKRVAETAGLYVRNIVVRWRAARLRSLLRLAGPSTPHSPGTGGGTF
jgi:glycosyltransferase involved in cell wall biosynthesis